ncbi:MAG TPA: hypothetical protein VJU18_08920 [Vicinamibacteria bacterium]|nr:hypothetical protein [Vicinamibacteria bacterium]
MSLEDDLKSKTLALISRQMANWVVDIQRHIGRHQENLVRSLDELQETVARYDEKIDETEIGQSMAEVVASQPPPPPAPPAAAEGPGFAELRASLSAIEKGTSLSEVLTFLVNEITGYVDRAAMFIVKGSAAIGWYAKGIDSADAVKQTTVALATDTVFRTVHNSRQAMRGQLQSSPGTVQALLRLGGNPRGMMAVPLILRDKLAAILYADTTSGQIPDQVADLIEVLVLVAGKIVDVISSAPKTAVTRTTGSISVEKAQAIKADTEEVRERAGFPRPAPPAPPTPPPAAQDQSSTVMFGPAAMAGLRQPAATPPPAPRTPPAPSAPVALTPEQQKAHEDAKRFARLVVSEIKLYNEAKVNEGRRHKDLYERLKEDIERGRQMYADRVAPGVRETTNYFFEELVRILGGGDPSALGPM